MRGCYTLALPLLSSSRYSPHPLQQAVVKNALTAHHAHTVTKGEGMAQVLRLDGNSIRDFTEDQRDAFRLEAAKVHAVAVLALVSILAMAFIFTLVDELLGHTLLPYKNELKDVPPAVHAFGILLMIFILYKISPNCIYIIKSHDPALFINDGDIYIGGTMIETEGLISIDLDSDYGKIYVTHNSGERQKLEWKGLCRGIVDLFKAFGASEVSV